MTYDEVLRRIDARERWIRKKAASLVRMELTQIIPDPIPAIYKKPIVKTKVRKPKAPKEPKTPIDVQVGQFFVRFD